MPITTASAPQDATDTALRGYTALAQAQSPHQLAMDSGGGEPAKLHEPLARYHLDQEALSVATSAADAKQVGWCYLIGHGDNTRTIEVSGNEVDAITQGKVATNVVRAMDVATSTVDESTQYEARLLEFGRVASSLLWLHTEIGKDRFFSLGPDPEEVDEKTIVEKAAGKARFRKDRATARPPEEQVSSTPKEDLTIERGSGIEPISTPSATFNSDDIGG